MKIFLVINFFILTQAHALRSELKRYTLLADRVSVDRRLKNPDHNHFFSFDLNISSGLKKTIGDVKNDSASGSTTDKTLAMAEILLKNINTEQFVDLNVEVGAPLPYIKIGSQRFLPSLFYTKNFGVSLSIANIDNPTSPEAQIYFKHDSKLGIHTLYKTNHKSKAHWSFDLYRLTRSDTIARTTSSDLATSGKLFNFDDLKKEDESLQTNIQYHFNHPLYRYYYGINEIKLVSMGSDKEPIYSHKPVFVSQYNRKYKTEYMNIEPFFGLHYRSNYRPYQGLYAGTHLFFNFNVPFEFIFKADEKFLTFMPMFNTRYFRFSYSYKNPFRNPQEKLWVASSHMLNLTIPFP